MHLLEVGNRLLYRYVARRKRGKRRVRQDERVQASGLKRATRRHDDVTFVVRLIVRARRRWDTKELVEGRDVWSRPRVLEL